MTSRVWTGLLLRICGQVPEAAGRQIQALRPRLLALQLLATVLPALDTKQNGQYAAQVVRSDWDALLCIATMWIRGIGQGRGNYFEVGGGRFRVQSNPYSKLKTPRIWPTVTIF